ncbi:MAG: SAM-dependent methyltransferase [Candidatus Pacearchaeota archaeon]
MKKIFVIEHLEKRIWKWCIFEYKSISNIVGKENLWITNIKRKNKNLEGLGKIFKERFFLLMKEKNIDETKVCVLDPQAEKELTPEESKNFDYFVFGGILGDFPPKKRTKKELSSFLISCEKRNIGKKQFPTDNAVLVVKKIIEGVPLKEMRFKNKFVLKINDYESIELPFRYLVLNEKPFISEEIVNYLKKKRSF